jgi:hypothetical protein
VTAQGKVARLTRKQTKKMARPSRVNDRSKKNLLARWQGSGEATGHKKKIAARQRKRCSATKKAGDRPATGQKGAARLKKLQVTDLRGQASQRPVQPVHNAGSTGFNQDGPGKNWLKTAEL